MRKGWIVLLTAILVVAFAAPAMADLKVTGFYAAKSMLSNFFDGSGGPSIRTSEEEQSNAYVEQRARLKFDVGAENVRAIFHFESDMVWGIGPTGAARNSGGQLSADSVQLETKNVYIWFKIPDTSLQATVGMQPFNDHYAGMFSNAADFTSIMLNGQAEPVKWTLAWGKLYENTNNGAVASAGYGAADDTDIYVASVQFAPAKDMNLGVNLYVVTDDSGKSIANGSSHLAPAGDALNGYKVDVYMPGVNFAMNAGAVKLNAFAFYQWGTADSTVPGVEDLDISAFGLDVRGELKLGPGNLWLEGFYLSGGDGTGNDYEAPITLGDYQLDGTGGNAGFGRTHMYFLFGYDSYQVSQCLIGCSGGEYGDSLGNSGRGLWHIAAGYNQKFSEKLKGEVNIGYLAATDLLDGESAYRDKDFGTEINARVDYTITKGLTASLAAAYLMMGDFVTDGPGEPEFEDSYYMGYALLRYNF